MSNYAEKYIDSIKVENTKKVMVHILKKVDVTNIENCSPIQIEQLIIDSKPNSFKSIITTIYVLSAYVKWLQEQGVIDNNNVYQILQSLDKKLLWKKAKSNAPKKFISNQQFKTVIHDIEMYEEYNPLYYTTLFRAIYEGVYNDDLSVLKNLRKSDINGNILTLREDTNHIYRIKVSERLSKDLRQLADINTWQRPNRFSVCNVGMRGLYADSVFKMENRSSASNDSMRFSYYAKLRRIARDYLEYSLLPLQLYASGIMYRIKVELEDNDITLQEAFIDSTRNKLAHMIIENELIRSNSGIEIANLRELVKGHLDSF